MSVSECKAPTGCGFNSARKIEGTILTDTETLARVDSSAQVGAKAKTECHPSTVTDGKCAPATQAEWDAFDPKGACDTSYVKLGGKVETPFDLNVITAGKVKLDGTAQAGVTDNSVITFSDCPAPDAA